METMARNTAMQVEREPAKGINERRALAAVLLTACVMRLWWMALDLHAGSHPSADAAHGSYGAMANTLSNLPAAFLSLQALIGSISGPGGAGRAAEAVAGVVAVAVAYQLVRRISGSVSGLLAALVLAVTPIDLGMARSGSSDSYIVLCLLLAALSLQKAIEKERIGPALLCAAFLALALNVNALSMLPGRPVFALLCVGALIVAFAVPASRRRTRY